MKRSVVFFLAVLLAVLPLMSSCGSGEESVSANVIISPSEIEMAVGDVYTLGVTVFPKKFRDLGVNWSVSDSDIVGCVDGRIEAKAEGVALVFATVGSARYSCSVRIGSSSNMIVGEQASLSVAKQNTLNSAEKITLSSDVLSYSDGVITANKEGEGSVVAHFENGDRLTVASICVRDIRFSIVNDDEEINSKIKIYDTQIEKILYEQNNYLIYCNFKYAMADGVQEDSYTVGFRVTLYSNEIDGEYCRHTDVYTNVKAGEEYTYYERQFLAELKDGNSRNFRIEITPITEEEKK